MGHIFILLGILIATACSRPTEYVYVPQSVPQEEVVATRYVHRYGVSVPDYQWNEGGQSGQIILTTRDGVTRSESYYCGALEGETKQTFPFSDSIAKVEHYSQDQLKREATYYPSGQMHTETIHKSPDPTEVREWYENGVLKSYEKYAGSLLSYGEYYDTKGQRTSEIDNGSGLKTMRDVYGLLWSTDELKDGAVVTRITYYANGAPKEIDPYKNGVVDGFRKTYYEGGEPKTIETWVDGKQEGITTVFLNGEKSQEIPYRNGLKNGIGKVYRDGAVVVQEITWKDDQMSGPCRTYIEDRVATEWYMRGKKVSKAYYDSFHFTPRPVETPSEEVKGSSPSSLPEAA